MRAAGFDVARGWIETGRRAGGITVVLVVALAGCDSVYDTQGCELQLRPAFAVDVEDAATGQPLAWGSQAWTERLGVRRDMRLEVPAGDTLSAVRFNAFVEPGRYDLFVERPGYLRWSVTGIDAPRGPCAPRTRTFAAPLVRAD